MIDQKMLLSNQTAGFFDHKSIWKEAMNVIALFHRESYYGKIASRSATVGWP